MAIRPILTVDKPADMAVLKKKSEPVAQVDDALRALMDDMLETMYAAPGIGLAAVQVGEPIRVIVMDLTREPDQKDPRYFVNPEIVWASEETAPYEEGCLSVPEIYDEVERPAKVRLKYLGYSGEAHEEEAEGLFAVCIQHEMDHLEGVLFIDHLSRLKRDRAVAKVKKAAVKSAAWGPAPVKIRLYQPGDAAALSALNYASVREIGPRDYSIEQVIAWAPKPLDQSRYETASRDGRVMLVAVDEGDQPIGYGELEPDGHIDHLYCRPDHVGAGVGWALVDGLEAIAQERGIRRLYVEASEAAKRLFLRKGYELVERRRFILRGVAIHNYLMARTL